MANTWREWLAALAAGVLLGHAPSVMAADAARAGEPDPPVRLGEPADGGDAVRFAYKGAEFCVRCHRSEQSEWCDTATTAIWRHDAHSRSHLALRSSNPRTRGMEEALGITAIRTASCVACHTHPADEPAPEEEVPEEENRFLHAGISCETCHGAGAGYVEPHLHPAWRFLPPDEKARHGMIDLRYPVLKAENCLGCHLGDPDTDRVVPHAAYAAGHPPLGAFDIEAASRAMGPHWKRVWEKSERIQTLAAAADDRVEAASVAHRSLIGALVALRESGLLVQKGAARATGTAADPSASWPELSLYDCQACHHDLVVPSRRQQAGYGGLVPGRPGLVRWPQRAAEAAFAVAEMPTTADAVLAPWITALNARPFGRPDDLRAPPGAAESLARIDAAIAALAAERRDSDLPARQQRIAVTLAAAGPRSSDLDTARAVGWPLVSSLADAEGWPDDIRTAALARLTDVLALSIPGPPPGSDESRAFWRTSLDAAAAYDPAAVAEAFRLPAAPPPERLPPR
ncbi:MAG: multiheme c-type cytochrome [Planctomycetaceae bacterium]